MNWLGRLAAPAGAINRGARLASAQPLVEARQALRELGARLVAELGPRPGHVGVRDEDVTRLHRAPVEDWLDAALLADRGDELGQRNRARLPEVVDRIAARAVERAHDAVDDVVDVGVVAPRRAVAEERDRLARQALLREHVDRHLRALARTVDSEEAQARDRRAVEMVVREAQELARAL